MNTEATAIGAPSGAVHDGSASVPRAKLIQKQRFAHMLDRFTWQVQHGCEHPQCTTPTCYTYRYREGRPPPRKHSSLATNAFALILAGRNDAAAFLCPHLPDDIPHFSLTIPDRIDQKSLTQRLSCTQAVQTIHDSCHTNGAQRSTSSPGLPLCVVKNKDELSGRDLCQLQEYYTSPARLLHSDSPDDSVVEEYLCTILSDPRRLLFSCASEEVPDDMSGNGGSMRQFILSIQQILNTILAYTPGSFYQSLSQCLDRIPVLDGDMSVNNGAIFVCVCAIGMCIDHECIEEFDKEPWGSRWTEILREGQDEDRSRTCTLRIVNALYRLAATSGHPDLIHHTARAAQAGDELDPITDFVRWFHVVPLSRPSGSKLPEEAELTPLWPFLRSARSLVLHLWDGSHFVERKTALFNTLDLLRRIANFQGEVAWPFTTIYEIANEGLDIEAACQTYLTVKGTGRHILSWNFLYHPRKQWLFFRTACYLRMRDAVKEVQYASLCRRRYAFQYSDDDEAYLNVRMRTMTDHYLILRITRHNLLRDAFDQIWHREYREILRPLRVRLGDDEGELGQDQGGVQVEFFSLLCEEICKPGNPFFEADPKTNLMWFRPGSLEPLYRYELLGLLFGLALHNGITLPVSFPLVFYKRLMGHKTSLDDLTERWEEQSQSMRWIVEYEGDDLESDLGLDFVFTLQANGVTLTTGRYDTSQNLMATNDEKARVPVLTIMHDRHVEATKKKKSKKSMEQDSGSRDSTQSADEQPITDPAKDHELNIKPEDLSWPGWSFTTAENPPPALTSANRSRYVEAYTQWILDWSIRPQFYAFARGFFQIIDLRALHLMLPENFRALAEGQATFTARDLELQATNAGYERSSPQLFWFWEIVRTYDQEKLRKLLEFVTASKRLPPLYAAPVKFIVQRMEGEDLEQLPVSSTCYGTLFLPDYPSKEIMDRKLEIALQYGVGFGVA